MMSPPLPEQVDEWLELQGRNFSELTTSAERAYQQLCAELDATEQALEAQQHRMRLPMCWGWRVCA